MQHGGHGVYVWRVLWGYELTKIRKLLDRQANLHERDPEERNGAWSRAARVSAAQALLDRGWGSAPQPHTGEDGDVRVTMRTRSRATLRVLDRR